MGLSASVILVLATIASGQELPNQTDQSVQWLRGRDMDRQAQLAIAGDWFEAPLRPLLIQLSQGFGIPLFIDRRVDPDIPVTMTARDLTWDQFLFELGDPHGLGFCRLEGMYYFGPREIAHTLPQHYEKLCRWIAKHRQDSAVNWRKPIPGSWARLCQPRELLQTLVSQNQLEVFELDEIPLDVWPARESPNVPLVLQASMLAVGFDKWIAISKSGRKLKIVEYPEWETASYNVDKIENPREAISELNAMFPSLNIRARKSTIEISGPTREISPAVAAAIGMQTAIRTSESVSTFSGELQGKRSALLASMATQLGVELVVPASQNEQLDVHIEIAVKDESAAGIIRKVLIGSGYDFQLDQKYLKVYQKR